MQILDVEQKTGLDRATIRFYEKENLVVPKRESNGYRIYTQDDLQLLLKVKLLRQLGVPLCKIKELHQGSGDFSVVLQEQIRFLEQQITDNTKAKRVCLEIQRTRVAYSDLDAQVYLKMLQSQTEPLRLSYQEPLNKESHPVRRFLARSIDIAWLAALINFLVIVIFRIRPISNMFLTAIGALSYLAIIPIEAVLLHLWGTTPGKWAMGIHIENINGGKLTYHDASVRGMYIIRYGYGFGIPIWSLWKLYNSYKDGDDNPWNEESEIIYDDWSGIRKATFLALVTLTLLTRVFAGFDIILPQHRGNIQINQFVSNYNSYEHIFGYGDNYYIMKLDGTWDTRAGDGPIVIIGPADHEREAFSYDSEDGYITGIHFEDRWENPNFMDALPYYCKCAIFAFVGSRPECTYRDILNLDGELVPKFYDTLETESSGKIFIADVCVEWSTQMADIRGIHDGMLYSDENVPSNYYLKLDMYIIE